MNNNFELALQLLGIGMLTVFLILFLVIFIGNTIIWFVNRYMPELQTKKAVTTRKTSDIDAGKMAAIVAAVQTVTNGQGKVVKIEKV